MQSVLAFSKYVRNNNKCRVWIVILLILATMASVQYFVIGGKTQILSSVNYIPFLTQKHENETYQNQGILGLRNKSVQFAPKIFSSTKLSTGSQAEDKEHDSPRNTYHGSADPKTVCKFRKIHTPDPKLMKLVEQQNNPTDCSTGMPSLVYRDGNVLSVNFTKMKKTVKSIDYCRYTPLVFGRTNDNGLGPQKWSAKFLLKSMNLSKTDEHILVECYRNNSLVAETYMSRIVEKTPELEKTRDANYKRHLQEDSPLEKMNVLIIGMDGMSKQNLIRTMPKTRGYILDHLRARELNMFNKIGDNTFPNMVGLHSGLDEIDIRKTLGWSNGKYLDMIDNHFLWNDYHKAGYRTGMNLDAIQITAFHYAKRGWQKPIFDYYPRPMLLQLDKNEKHSKTAGHLCVGDTLLLDKLHDYIFQIASAFNNSKPYFVHNFFTSLTHNNQANAVKADTNYMNLFKKLKDEKLLHNTLTIFFSDHGSRFGDYRKTFNGMIEINTPFMFFMFPSWFEAKYPKLMKTFETNQDRLTTFFDIHKTLKDFLNFKGNTTKRTVHDRAISLFDEIPIERTCTHADIPMEFCNCNLVYNGPVPKNVSGDITGYLFNTIVNKTKVFRNQCAMLTLASVHSILTVTLKEKDPYQVKHYQVIVETNPGGGVFEALLKYDKTSRTTSVIGSIVRVNMYKGQDECTKNLLLKPFCYCKKST